MAAAAAAWIESTEQLTADLTGARLVASGDGAYVFMLPSPNPQAAKTVLIRAHTPSWWQAGLAALAGCVVPGGGRATVALQVVARVSEAGPVPGSEQLVHVVAGAEGHLRWAVVGTVIGAIARAAHALGQCGPPPTPRRPRTTGPQRLPLSTRFQSILALAAGFALRPAELEQCMAMGANGVQATTAAEHVLVVHERNRVTATCTNVGGVGGAPTVRVGYIHPAARFVGARWDFNGCTHADCCVEAIAVACCLVVSNAVSVARKRAA